MSSQQQQPRSSSSSNSNGDEDGEDDRKPAARPSSTTSPMVEESMSAPEFRSVSIARPQSLAGPVASFARSSISSSSGKHHISSEDEVIDKASYFSAASAEDKLAGSKPHARSSSSSTATGNTPSNNNWSPRQLRPVPAFYPMERSSRLCYECDLETVARRVSEANRLLSIHAVYCDETATASLLTSENVEMHLALWKTPVPEGGGNDDSNTHAQASSMSMPTSDGIVIEIQRRTGDSIAFHRYSRYILDAAVGEFNVQALIDEEGADLDVVYSKRAQRLLSVDTVSTASSSQESRTETENAIIAIEIAHGLIMKDRMDARQLGLESLCLLTDPKKTGLTTALLASHVVLLGTGPDMGDPEEGQQLMYDEAPFQEIRQTILSLIQFRRIGDADEFEDTVDIGTTDEEYITILHNLALAVLANALDVIENEDLLTESAPEEIRTRARTETTESISERFMDDAQEYSENQDILKTLISELGKAGARPHNATLSAKCIGSLCRASDKARSRAKELGAKTVVQTALDVGSRTHLKLEQESRKVMQSLTGTVTAAPLPTVPSEDDEEAP